MFLTLLFKLIFTSLLFPSYGRSLDTEVQQLQSGVTVLFVLLKVTTK